MSDAPVMFMELPCRAENDQMLDAPSTVRVRLDAASVALLEDVIGTYRRTKEKDRRYLEFDFPGASLEYWRDGACGPVRWDRDFENSIVSPSDEGVSFGSDVLNGWGDRAEDVLRAEVSYEELEEELRQWRSQVLGRQLEGAMAGEDAPAPKKTTSGMSPL